MMSDETLSFVMVGHIDHGKSTLIGRLLYDTDSLPDGKMEEIEAAAREEGRPLEFGYVVDHLAEERSRGITIDTAQIYFSSEVRDYVIIDAPGHKEFIKNMITGASQAEAAVLICSAFEGVQEQTKRHAYVIRLLGLDQVLVAYNKMDLVGYDQKRFEAVRKEMRAFLARLGVTPSVEVPVSASVGDNIARRSENMPWYSGLTVCEGLDMFKKMPAPTEKALRFPIQDIYVREGRPIAAGRVESGVLHKGERLRFLPGDKVCTVKEIRQYLRNDMLSAEAGECIGALFDVDGLKRGQVGCPVGDKLTMTQRLGASVFWLSPRPLETTLETAHEGRLVFKCATQEVPCRVAEIRERLNSSTLEELDASAGRLEETEVGDMVIETEAPVVVESFYDVAELGRFVLVRGHDVVAGGIVTAGRA
jgi:small GTP-binding protein